MLLHVRDKGVSGHAKKGYQDSRVSWNLRLSGYCFGRVIHRHDLRLRRRRDFSCLQNIIPSSHQFKHVITVCVERVVLSTGPAGILGEWSSWFIRGQVEASDQMGVRGPETKLTDGFLLL